MWAKRNPHTFIGARYRRIASHRGPPRANVAVQHTLPTAIRHMGTTGTLYEDLGGDHHSRHNPDRTRTRTIRQLGPDGHRRTAPAASVAARDRVRVGP